MTEESITEAIHTLLLLEDIFSIEEITHQAISEV